MKVLLITFILSSLAQAHVPYNYVLESFGHQSPRATFEIFLNETGLKVEDLTNYHCGTPESEELITEYNHGDNANHNSLQIIGGSSTNFIKEVHKALNYIQKTKVGDQLIKAINKSPFKIYIKKGGNRFSPTIKNGRAGFGLNNASMISNLDLIAPMVEKIPTDTIGVGGSVHWNPKTQQANPAIALAHEIFHAYDSTRGMLDLRWIKSEDIEFVQVLEARAVYFANQMRKELGEKYRAHYGANSTGPDLLDDSGEPFFMPNPCIKSLN